MVNDTERPNQVEAAYVILEYARQFLGIANNEADGVIELGIIGDETISAELEAYGGHIHYRQNCPCKRKVESSGAESSAHFQHFFAFPTREIGEWRDVGFDFVLSHFGGFIIPFGTLFNTREIPLRIACIGIPITLYIGFLGSAVIDRRERFSGEKAIICRNMFTLMNNLAWSQGIDILQSIVSPCLQSNSASFSFTATLLAAIRANATAMVAATHNPTGLVMIPQGQNTDDNHGAKARFPF
jgi:hypothetical protein